jgi:hypothetical protein
LKQSALPSSASSYYSKEAEVTFNLWVSSEALLVNPSKVVSRSAGALQIAHKVPLYQLISPFSPLSLQA